MGGTDGAGKSREGLWVAVYGPDGAGKSAVIQQLASGLTPLFSAIRMYHLRIPLWRYSGPPASVTNPHGQPPRGTFLSCLKLLYMLAHAWLTHFLFVVPSLVSGQLVLFDRYFLDYTIDPQRYRLAKQSSGFARLLARLAPRPDVQFVLDVSAEELQKRKREVSFAESGRQRRAYANLQSSADAVLVNADRPIAAIAGEITDVIAVRTTDRQPAGEAFVANA